MKSYKKIILFYVALLLASCNNATDLDNTDTNNNGGISMPNSNDNYNIVWSPNLFKKKAFETAVDDPAKGLSFYLETAKLELKKNFDNYDGKVNIMMVESSVEDSKHLNLIFFISNGTDETIRDLGFGLKITDAITNEICVNFEKADIPQEFVEEIPPKTVYGIILGVKDAVSDPTGDITSILNNGDVTYNATVYYNTV